MGFPPEGTESVHSETERAGFFFNSMRNLLVFKLDSVPFLVETLVTGFGVGDTSPTCEPLPHQSLHLVTNGNAIYANNNNFLMG
jgi:hypothetical protein